MGILIAVNQFLISLLAMPFLGISFYFANALSERFKNDAEEFDYEIISPEGETVEKSVSEAKADRLLAKWFIISYSILILHNIFNVEGYTRFPPIFLLLSPLLGLVIATLIIGIFVGIWNLVKMKNFWGDQPKKLFLVSTFKAISVVYGLGILLNLSWPN